MLRLTRFAYEAPPSLAEAGARARELGPEAVVMAGGTDVLVNIKQRVCTPRVVIGIRHLPELGAIAADPDGGLTLGAGVTLARLETDPRVLARYPALAYAASVISAPQVRNVATLGGNVCLDVRCNYYNQSEEWRRAIGYCMKRDSAICRVAPGGDRCWAVSSADTVPVLMALDAEVTVLGERGEAHVPIAALFQDDGLVPLTLAPGDLVAAVHLPPPAGQACVYKKFRLRHSFDFPLVGAAVALRVDEGLIRDPHIVLTAVASRPERVTAAEEALDGRALDDASIAATGEAVYRAAKPMDNTAGTVFHRKRMARVLVERALRDLGARRR